MVFYVIGNGFDQHYGLDTSYHSFKKYLTIANREVVERIDDLFYKMCIRDRCMEYEIRKATGTFYRFSYMVKSWDA